MRWSGKWGSKALQSRRLAEVGAAVVLWIALGLALRLSPNAYLLLGIPLTAAFQWIVARRPLCALWLRDAPPFRLGVIGWSAAAALAVYPAIRLAQNLRTAPYSAETLWYAAAALGALPAGYTLSRFTRSTARDLGFGLATAGVLGIGFVLLSAFTTGLSDRTLAGRLEFGAASLLLYVPVVFLLEEVSFRGAFDSHVYRPGEPREYATAFAISALWGLWHIPMVVGGRVPVWAQIPGLIGVHCAIGVPLSLTWRRSGNLLTSGVVHALIDAVRNALFL
jgi:hypothetical protein